MKYVIIRDDDTNALTPIECLERLYRPFLDRGLPVNLATIPNVNTEALHCDGGTELFLLAKKAPAPKYLPIACSVKLVEYLHANPGYRIVQHGCRHEFVDGKTEFDRDDRSDICARLEEGTRCLLEAGFPKPRAFVAPYDRLSRTSHQAVAERFSVLSTGWFEWRRLPVSWLPQYGLRKLTAQNHWRVNGTILLTHPGCHLSYHRPLASMLDEIKASVDSRRLTVLVSHWWEYFRDHKPDDAFIGVLHETAAYLAARRDVRVISFTDLLQGNIPYN
jgi:hypothetical protein